MQEFRRARRSRRYGACLDRPASRCFKNGRRFHSNVIETPPSKPGSTGCCILRLPSPTGCWWIRSSVAGHTNRAAAPATARSIPSTIVRTSGKLAVAHFHCMKRYCITKPPTQVCAGWTRCSADPCFALGQAERHAWAAFVPSDIKTEQLRSDPGQESQFSDLVS